MKRKRTVNAHTAGGMALSFCASLVIGAGQALAHEEKHTAEQLKAYEEVFMEQVRLGDLLFHGDADTEK